MRIEGSTGLDCLADGLGGNQREPNPGNRIRVLYSESRYGIDGNVACKRAPDWKSVLPIGRLGCLLQAAEGEGAPFSRCLLYRKAWMLVPDRTGK